MKLLCLLLGLAISLSACARDPLNPAPPKLPYNHWSVSLGAPSYMEVWVESVDVLDQRGLAYYRVHGGIASVQRPPDNKGDPRGWPKRVGAGALKPMTNIDLPEIIFVRWQSLVEPQTYHVRINIPEWAREEMLKPDEAYCRFDGKNVTSYRKNVTLGLAPGGIAKAWLIGGCLEPIEIGRFVGKIHPEGPDQGRSEGRYALPLSEESKAYIEAHGIPYDSW
ncbi:DUF2931 family protein [Halopseudomonas sp.]|jgi:hypothetical protein|uniref:DUF2931 family protein n=1 Tax=Halopseudomonas sp. TaxID=2901191 RepID=UPI0039E4A99D